MSSWFLTNSSTEASREHYLCSTTRRRAWSALTTGCSGQSAARPTAEPERWVDQRHPEPSPGGELGLQQSALTGAAAMATKDTAQRTPMAEASHQNHQRRIES